MSFQAWTPAEVARVDKCIELGVGPVAAVRFFPARTRWALHTKMGQRRAVLGIDGKCGRPVVSTRDAIRELHRLYTPKSPAKFVVSTALVRLPKPYTGDTPEAESSRRLLRRQLETGMHYITDPARFATVCRDVGLAA